MVFAGAVVLLTVGLLGSSCAQQDWGKYWHVTDFHYDPTYNDRQLSCSQDNNPTTDRQYGQPWCDSPWALVESFINKMSLWEFRPDFILWTGDSVFQGDDSDLSNDIITGVIYNITDAIKAQFPTTPVYATLGNHDYFPSYQFPPHNNWLYNWTLEKWADWIGDTSQHDNFRKGAYYTVKTQRGLRIVALNTNLYSTSNNATFNVTDPADQLHWLNKTLHDAETNQEKVLVTGHTSPGVHAPGGIVWMREVHHTKLVHILRRYADVIVSMHFGHAHTDTFKILDNGRGDPAGVPIFIAPSVTPNRHLAPDVTLPPHNPGMHIFRYNRTTGTPLTLAQFWFKMDKANRLHSDDWNWGIAYNSRSLFTPKLPNLTARILLDRVGLFAERSWEFDEYWNRYTVYPPDTSFDRKSCDAECRAEVLCGFTHFDYDEWLQCKNTEYSSASSLKLDLVLTVICALLLVFSLN